MTVRPFVRSLAALAAAVLAASCGTGTLCNGECEPGFVCDETRLACVPDDGRFDAGTPDGGAGCIDDTGCTLASTPRCLVTSGTCVACLVNTDCGGARCNPATNICETAECTRTSDCADVPERPFCSAAGACVQCRVDDDCPTLEGMPRACDAALSAACVEDPCSEDADCVGEAGPSCDAASGRCVVCANDDDCPSGRCLVSADRCVECLENPDCDTSLGESCDLATNTCVLTGCASDAQCVGPELCDTGARDCVNCLTTDDCAFGGTCSADRCVDPATCTVDSDCTFGRFCTSTGCAACRTSADCSGQKTCTDGACVEPATCTTAADCRAGRTCQNGTCTASCTVDAFEPNDGAGDARPLDSGVLNAFLCPNETDHFALEVPSGSGVEASLTHAANLAPRVELVGVSGGAAQVIATGAPAGTGVTRVLVETAPAGAETVLVRIASTGLAGTYELTTRVSGAICENDGAEPDDSNLQARPAGRGTFEGVICPNDQDWFQVDVEEGQRLSVTAATNGTRGTSTIEIYTLVNSTLARDANGFDSATASGVASAGGQRYWVVLRNQTSRKLTYTCPAVCASDPSGDPACATCGLRITVKPPNDACTLPRALPLNATSSGTTNGASDGTNGDLAAASCGGAGNDVFWRFDLAQPATVRLELQSNFDAVLALTGSCAGAEFGCAAGDGAEVLSFDGLPAGSYVVRVDSRGGSGTYTLGLTASPAAAAPVNESCDVVRAIDPVAAAVDVSGNLALGKDDVIPVCGASGNDAVYAFTLQTARRLRATLTAFDGAGLSLVPASDCGLSAGTCARAVRATATAPWAASLDVPAVAAGDWVLVVDGGSNRAGLFSLHVETLEAIFPPANDACAGVLPLTSAAPVTGDTRGGLDDRAPACGASGGAARDVVYRYTVASEQLVTFALDAAFDATVQVTADTCEAGPVLACDDGRAARLTFPALAPGDYYVWVDGYRDAAGTYALAVTESPAPPLPANDQCAAPTPVVPDSGPVTSHTGRAGGDLAPADCRPTPTGRPLTLAGRDVVYSVTVPAGRQLRATVTPVGYDAALYLLATCAETTCVAASDGSFVAGAAETVVARNTGASDVTWLLVVDSYADAAWGAFSLDVRLDP